jgi:hypothetical protein
VFYEILTCRVPFAECDSLVAVVAASGVRRERPELRAGPQCPQHVVDLLVRMWDPIPNARPDAPEVAHIVSRMELSEVLGQPYLYAENTRYERPVSWGLDLRALADTPAERLRFPRNTAVGAAVRWFRLIADRYARTAKRCKAPSRSGRSSAVVVQKKPPLNRYQRFGVAVEWLKRAVAHGCGRSLTILWRFLSSEGGCRSR